MSPQNLVVRQSFNNTGVCIYPPAAIVTITLKKEGTVVGESVTRDIAGEFVTVDFGPQPNGTYTTESQAKRADGSNVGDKTVNTINHDWTDTVLPGDLTQVV